MEVAEIQGEVGHTVLLGKSQGVSEWYYSVETHLYGLFLYCFLIVKYFFICIFIFWPGPVGMGDLSSPPRD